MKRYDQLLSVYRKRLPATERFRGHALNLAYFAACGMVERARGYLTCLRHDWSTQSRAWDSVRFWEFQEVVIADATENAQEGSGDEAFA